MAQLRMTFVSRGPSASAGSRAWRWQTRLDLCRAFARPLLTSTLALVATATKTGSPPSKRLPWPVDVRGPRYRSEDVDELLDHMKGEH